MWGVSLTLRLLWLCRNNPARGLFRQKNGFLRVGALHRRTSCSLLHTVLFWHLYAWGGITTLGVCFMPLKRWTPAGHGGVFAVFMPPQNSPCAGRISPRRVHTPPQPLTAHTAAHTPKHGGFSGPMVTMFPATGSSTPSTLFRQISRSPLLLRKDTVMPFLLRASTLLRIRWEKLLGDRKSVV